jgi:hypothetical protein
VGDPARVLQQRLCVAAVGAAGEQDDVGARGADRRDLLRART